MKRRGESNIKTTFKSELRFLSFCLAMFQIGINSIMKIIQKTSPLTRPKYSSDILITYARIKAKQAVPVLSFPGNELKSYQVKQLITLLTEEGLI